MQDPEDFTVRISNSPQYRPILALDGGGNRVDYSLEILRRIADRLDKPVHELFPDVTGVSAGGLAAVGLYAPKKATHLPHSPLELQGILSQDAKEVFSKSSSIWALFRPRYSREGFVRMVNEVCPNARMSDLMAKHVLIPAGCTSPTKVQNVYFCENCTLLGSRNSAVQESAPVVDVLSATTAAPTFFPPYLATIAGEQYTLIDGGVGGNNPAALGKSHFMRFYDNTDIPVVCSIGTGDYIPNLPASVLNSDGELKWAELIAPAIFAQNTDRTNFMMEGKTYFRWDVRMDKDLKMDTTNPRDFKWLQEQADATLEEKPDEFNRMCELLERALKIRQA